MSEPHSLRSAADRNLLFGILALQLDFLDRDELVAAMNTWLLDKEKALGQILVERGALSDQYRQLLDSLVQVHVRKHGNDSRRSLEAVAAHSTVTEALNGVADRDVQSTLSELEPGDGRPIRSAASNGHRYRRLRVHARGGLGQVYVAEDTELHREVAVKEIQPERADDPSSRSRFLMEAEITGALEHPGIIPVYGLGAYADGRPYYAMRFVRGDSLKETIDQFHAQDWSLRPLLERISALRPLLRRLIDTCNAVAYAHSRGVLHRDLKPQNVMLGKFGETLVLDWGLAKVGIEAKDRESANDLTTDPLVRPSSGSEHGTRAGSTLGTPGYMSPEQAAGRHDELSPASDVYSLGVTLHVLLTGRKPGDESDTIPATGTNRPATDAPIGNGWQPAPLVAICRKAMAEQPRDRYPSPVDLAADLERWLADEPVGVYADPWTVRASRWARRHRTGVAAGLVLLVTSLIASAIGIGLIWREQRHTAEQKQVAQENYELARGLSSSGIELIASNEAEYAADPVKHAARKDLLVAATRAYHKHLDHQPGDEEVRRQAARVFRYTANVHRLERELMTAEPLYSEAIELLEGLAAEFKDEPAYHVQLSETLRDRAKVQSTLGRLAEAATSLRRAIDVAEGLASQDPDNPQFRRLLATGLQALSPVERHRGRYAEAGDTATRAAEYFRALADGESPHPYDRVLLAGSLSLRAAAEREAGRPAAARPLHEEAVKLLTDLSSRAPPGVNKADVLNFLALCRFDQCRTWALNPASRANAEKSLDGALRFLAELERLFPSVPMYREEAGTGHRLRGEIRLALGRPDEARADLDRSRDLLKAEVERSPKVPELKAELGRTHLALARLARAAGNAATAAESVREAVAALRSAVAEAPDRVQDRRDLEAAEAEAAH